MFLTIAAAVLALGFTVIVFASVWSSGRSIEAIPFNAERWRTSDPAEEDPPLRQRMVDDLLERGVLSRLTDDGVVELLGEPNKTERFGEYDLVYHLGPSRGLFPIDGEWLVIRLDGQALAARVRLVED